MATPTQPERDAFLWMQGRMVELLLRHDVQRFRATFDVHSADQALDPRLARYRELAVLFYLRDELFDSILPRIKRRLSFAAPRELLTEALPTRGRIDWGRTTTASFRDRPGETPLEVQTRQRRRHFATPENLLTVATLIEYRITAQRLLDDEATLDSTQAIRHPLHEIVDACTRELAFLQFAGLVRQASAIIDGAASMSTEELEAAVADDLLPGRNSAYDDLLAWRRRLSSLQLLERTSDADVQPMLGADSDRDNYLYQLWLFYELGEVLQRRGQLMSWNYDKMALTFSWGQDGEQRQYRLQHDQAIAGGPSYWRNAPGVRPDFYIEPLDRQEVRDDNNTIIWREPGYVLDAKYYRPRDDDPKAPSGPIKRMIADLQLTGERHGALLFAFHGESIDQSMLLDHRAISPEAVSAQYIQPDLRIGIWRVQPELADNSLLVESRLVQILDTVHTRLKTRVDVRCHGVFLETLSANAQGALAVAAGLQWRNGAPTTSDLEDLLVCPKPHIAPWRVDIVSLTRDCCENSALCHIKRQPGARKPQRLTALDEIAAAINNGESAGDDAAAIEAATRQVLVIVKRYAQLLQPDIAHYRRWMRDELEIGELFDLTPLITDPQRETLALARFIWEQIEHIKASNFAGPALLFTGVLEEITRITLFRHSPDLCDSSGRPLMKTLGALGNCKGRGGYNWQILEQAIVKRGYWQEQVSTQQTLSLSLWIDMVQKISSIRNDAAHRANVDPKAFRMLTGLYFGGSTSGVGVLNGLLLAWKSPSS